MHRSHKPVLVAVRFLIVEREVLDKRIHAFFSRAAHSACTAVMSSFNRLGATWAGGNYDLITGVLRNEFGVKGMVLTDSAVAAFSRARSTTTSRQTSTPNPAAASTLHTIESLKEITDYYDR